MPTQPKSKQKYKVLISENAMYEFTEALKENNIQLTKDDEVLITGDMSVTGPYNYRQVNLRHQILMEVVKVYEPPMDADKTSCLADAKHFIDFFDAVYKYVLTGDVPTDKPKPTTETPKSTGWN